MTNQYSPTHSDLENICRILETKNDRLPFWFQNSFPIALRELFINAIQSSYKTKRSSWVITFSCFIDTFNIEMLVQDNGIGLTEKDKKNMFRRGYSTKESRTYCENLGYGLYYSKKFVRELLFGEIFAYDNKCNLDLSTSGVTFKICIPLKNSKLSININVGLPMIKTAYELLQYEIIHKKKLWF